MNCFPNGYTSKCFYCEHLYKNKNKIFKYKICYHPLEHTMFFTKIIDVNKCYCFELFYKFEESLIYYAYLGCGQDE